MTMQCADSSKPVPSTSSEPDDSKLPTEEGKHTSQESASASERPRFNQALMKNVDCQDRK